MVQWFSYSAHKLLVKSDGQSEGEMLMQLIFSSH